MALRIFVAGARGAIGRHLVALLRDAGHRVTGASRTEAGRAALVESGVEAVVVDVFDAEALERAMREAAPQVVVHQVTDLGDFDAGAPEDALRRNARVRKLGSVNLVRAARLAGAERVVAQSIAWAYAPKATPHEETDPLDLQAVGLRAVTVLEGIVPLENAVLDQSDFDGLVLRYGQLYGPRTWSAEPKGTAPVHVEAAAYAAFLAVAHGRPGSYNITDPGGSASIVKATRELGWRPDFRVTV